MEKILSVQVAAYNAEKYICKCLDSFIDKCILEKIEVIVVNDGSSDNTSFLAHKYEKEYPGSFIVVDKENGGLGSACNAALDAASGKYIANVDSDDWVDTKALKNVISMLENCNSDLCLWGVYHYTNKAKKRKMSELDNLTEYQFDDVIDKAQMNIHTMLVKREIWVNNAIRCDEEYKLYTDVGWVNYLIPHINTIMNTGEYVYYYRISEGQSVSITGILKNQDSAIGMASSMCSFVNDKKGNVSVQKYNYILNNIAGAATLPYNIGLLEKNKTERMRKINDYDETLKRTSTDIYFRMPSYIRLLRKKSVLITSFLRLIYICKKRCWG